MNILYVSSKKNWGGVMSWMVRTASGLADRGHSVYIVSHPRSPLTPSHFPHLHIIPLALGFDSNPVTAWRLYRLIRKKRIDILVTNIQKEVVAGGRAAKWAGIPCVRRIGNAVDINHRIRKSQERYVTHNIIPGDFVFTEAKQRNPWIRRDHFSVVHNGSPYYTPSPEERNALRSQWNCTPEHCVIGTTVKLTRGKGLEALLKTFGELHTLHPHLRLVITGEGPQEQALKTLAQQLGIGPGTVFPGFTQHPLASAAAYDIAVLNSRSEGFSNSVVEYMAAGRPVVCTRVGGAAEILRDQENGLLIPAKNPAALQEALNRLIEDGALRTHLGEAAQTTVRNGFTEKHMVDGVEAVFSQVVNRS